MFEIWKLKLTKLINKIKIHKINFRFNRLRLHLLIFYLNQFTFHLNQLININHYPRMIYSAHALLPKTREQILLNPLFKMHNYKEHPNQSIHYILMWIKLIRVLRTNSFNWYKRHICIFLSYTLVILTLIRLKE